MAAVIQAWGYRITIDGVMVRTRDRDLQPLIELVYRDVEQPGTEDPEPNRTRAWRLIHALNALGQSADATFVRTDPATRGVPGRVYGGAR